jgi:catechol 2,3-dioxygenase-like lactoylglutathione lyase family enzyme
MSGANGAVVARIARFSVTTADARGLAVFYESAFGCRRLATETLGGPDFERVLGVQGTAMMITLGLGQEIIELLQFDPPGRPYPAGSSASDLVFQHFAIVVGDMAEAVRRLSAVAGWVAITKDGPQLLPVSSGGVAAFKFRDPEGHPLEFLTFPEGRVPPRWQSGTVNEACLGIDHSAISVSDSTASIAFYARLGFRVSARSINHGQQQDRLDDVRAAHVEVTALVPRQTAPHLALLCYRPVACSGLNDRNNSDIAATRLVLESCAAPGSDDGSVIQRCIRDPDGHLLLIVPLQPGS